MDWPLLALLVSATIMPLVLLFGFSGCIGPLAAECESDIDCPPGMRCADGGCISLSSAGGGLSAPQDLLASGVSTSEIELLWTNDDPSIVRFEVQRAEEAAEDDFATVGETTGLLFRDSGLQEGTTYLYQVRAFDGQEVSELSDQTSATTLPTTPTGLSANAAGADRINVAWANTSARATRFSVERRTPTTNFGEVFNGTQTAFTDPGLTEGTNHDYRVTAIVPNGFQNGVQQVVRSEASDSILATTFPATPRGLTATPQEVDRIDLSWTNASARATQFSVEERTPTTNFGEVSNQAQATFSHEGLAEGSDHEYRVIAIIPNGFQNGVQQAVRSAQSAPVAARTWAVAFSVDDLPDGQPLEGFCLLQRITAAQFALFPTLLNNVGATIRVTLKATSTNVLTINRIYVSRVAPAGDPWDSDGSDLTKVVDVDQGDPLLVLPADTVRVLGPIAYALDRTQNLLVAFDLGSTPGQVIVPSIVLTRADHYFKAATQESAVANRAADFSTGVNRHYMVQKIEVL